MKNSPKIHYLVGKKLVNVFFLYRDFDDFLKYVEENKPEFKLCTSEEKESNPEFDSIFCAELKENQYKALLPFVKA